MLLYLVRHGQTTFNAVDRLRGWMDPELTALGRQQASEAASKLPKLPVYSSDLRRARQTAAAVAKGLGSIYSTSPALRPWNVGIFAGQPAEVVHPKLLQFQAQPTLCVPFGEPWSEFVERFTSFLQTLREDTILVTHYRNVKYLISEVPTGAVTEYTYNAR